MTAGTKANENWKPSVNKGDQEHSPNCCSAVQSPHCIRESIGKDIHFDTACTVSSETCSDICCIIKKQTEFHSFATYDIKLFVHPKLESFTHPHSKSVWATLFHVIQFCSMDPQWNDEWLKGCKSTIQVSWKYMLYPKCSDTNCAFTVEYKMGEYMINASAMHIKFSKASRGLHNFTAI